ncbi:MAG: pyridoxamine 5'-phosphate oxidase family protein [Pseudomonadota bacterium]
MDNIAANSEDGFAALQAQLDAFVAQRQSLVLATQDEHGVCELGLAPFVWHEGGFAVLLSGLAPHTQHLARDSALQVMLLDDEASARQPFARQRLSLRCESVRLERESAQSDSWFDLLAQRFGSIVPLLRGLPDFNVHVLSPQQGRFVAGFGKAYRLQGLRVVEHLRN